jgi:hypothetical protein
MINIEVNRSAEGVERYFHRELAVSDYLMKCQPGFAALVNTISAVSVLPQARLRGYACPEKVGNKVSNLQRRVSGETEEQEKARERH